MKPVMSKRFFATLITTSILFSLNIVPANAATVNCGSGGNFTITSNIVTGSTSCAGAVNIPSGVTSIAEDAFKDQRLITSVVIPDTVVTISNGAFWGADGITSLTIGNGVATIGNLAFNGANKITSLNIPNSVITIGRNAFSGTALLTSLTLGNQLTTIDYGAFTGSRITSLIIPDSVTTIGQESFVNVPLTSLILGNSLTTIGEKAFENTRLTTLNIPSSVTTIESEAFSRTNVASFTFSGNAPSSVGLDAFGSRVPSATANVAYNATGFPANGSIWNQLRVVYGNAPSSDSGPSTASTTASVSTPTTVKTADAIFNLKNKKYLSKNSMKTKLRKNKSFKRNPKDLYKYSIFKASKKNCVMSGNYVVALKETGACEIWVTRTTSKGAKYKYWVKINYNK